VTKRIQGGSSHEKKKNLNLGTYLGNTLIGCQGHGHLKTKPHA